MIFEIIKAFISTIYLIPFMIIFSIKSVVYGIYLIKKYDPPLDDVLNDCMNKFFKDINIGYVVSTIFWIWIIKLIY